jgi:hypothetical protein
MPAGPAPLGFAYFAAAKFIGYTGFCHFFIAPKCKEVLDRTSNSDSSELRKGVPLSIKAGVIRTLIGLVTGAIVGIGFYKIPQIAMRYSPDTPYFFALLIPVRIAEWWLLLRWVYGDFHLTPRQYLGIIAIGIVTSFALDGLGVLAAFVIPGGAWIC